MIYINHLKKLIYVHLPKTGGTYIGNTLVKYYNFTSYNNLLHNGCPFFNKLFRTAHFPYMYNKHIGILEYCINSKYLNNHMGMTPDKWKTYTKFTFIRNPYNRFISGYKHLLRLIDTQITMDDIITEKYIETCSNSVFFHLFVSQTKQLLYNNKLMINIIKYSDNLECEFILLLLSFGFKPIHNNMKINYSTNKQHYELNDNIKLFINKQFSDDFKNFFNFTPFSQVLTCPNTVLDK